MKFVGCHISIKNGFAGAARTAAAIGATAFQFFSKNPRSIGVKQFGLADAAECKEICARHGIQSIIHTTYATNLAAEGPIREPTIQSLRNDLEIAEACGSVGVVVHFGKWKGSADPLAGYKVIISALNDTLRDWQGNALLLIENQAGEGTNIGSTLEELTSIRQLSERPEKIAFCLDTCHVFASGVWNGANWSQLAARGRELGYFEHLRALHLNDSVYPSGFRRDRHANIGGGEIGLNHISEVLAMKEMRDIPIVLETPVPRGSSHQEEISFVRTLAKT